MEWNNGQNEDQLVILTKRVFELEQEVKLLKQTVYSNQNRPAMPPPVATQPVPQVAQVQPTPQVPPVAPIPVQPVMIAPAPAPVPGPVPFQPPVPPPAPVPVPKKNTDFESKFGKTVMAVVASVLVIISFVLFAKLFFKESSNIAISAAIFVFSIAITVVGFVKMKSTIDNNSERRKFNTFYTALTGTGIGALYISIMTSHFYLEVYSVIVLAILLAVWLVVTLAIAYKTPIIFAYICNAGLIIASLLAAVEWNKAPIGVAAYMITLTALYIMKHRDRLYKDGIFYFQTPLVSIFLSSIYGNDSLIAQVMLMVFTVAVIVFPYFSRKYNWDFLPKVDDNAKALTTIVASLATLVSYVTFAFVINYISDVFDLSGKLNLLYLIPIALVIGILVLCYRKFAHKLEEIFYLAFAGGIIITLAFLNAGELYDYVNLLPYIPLLFIGIALNNKAIKYVGAGALILELFTSYKFGFYVNISILAVAALIWAIIVILKKYSEVDKWLLTAFVFGLVTSLAIENDLSGEIYWIITAFICVIINLPFFSINPNDHKEERTSLIISSVLNAIAIFTGLILVASEYISLTSWIIALLILIANCLVNVKRVSRIINSEFWASIYTPFKLTLLILACLFRFSVASYVYSLVGIVIAILAIALGFAIRLKGTRLYGLTLSLLCVCKLLIFDVAIDSDIYKAISVLAAGVLCFVISFIYSLLEKQTKQN